MKDSILDIKSVGDLLGENFFIPNFQRGYRWEAQQIIDLLDDLNDFKDKNAGNNKDAFYCLQPLVVQKHNKEQEKEILKRIHESNDLEQITKIVSNYKNSWMVIDGQQRLTTICIILQIINGEDNFNIEYQVLPKSQEHINNIEKLSDADAEQDINLYHIKECYKIAKQWFDDNDIDKHAFSDLILNYAKFIWYENNNEDPIKIFTRLNIGQIKLTNSELIKALFLNSDNFKEGNVSERQDELAQEWDNIEINLQNNDFFLFLNSLYDFDNYKKPTRIDFLLDFICKYNKKNNSQKGLIEYNEDFVGTDNYRSFRCFYDCYKNHREEFEKLWEGTVRHVFDVFYEWFIDINLYHYIGYVLYCKGATLKELYDKWEETDRISFLEDYLFNLIKTKCLRNCQDINHEYDINTKFGKAEPLLLLHNVQTIINQNKVMKENAKYEMGVYYKFLFHLYKLEKWNIEHIDSNTDNTLEKDMDRSEWLLSIYPCLTEKELKEKEEKLNGKTLGDSLSDFLNNPNGNDANEQFKKLQDVIYKKLKINPSNNSNWKNRIYNYTLLDETTNTSYKNAIFPVKRIHIVDKEKGLRKEAVWDKDKGEIRIEKKEAKSAFVPICTSKVFQRAYTSTISDITRWSKDDALAYANDIVDTLTGVPLTSKGRNGNNTFDFIIKQEVKIDE